MSRRSTSSLHPSPLRIAVSVQTKIRPVPGARFSNESSRNKKRKVPKFTVFCAFCHGIQKVFAGMIKNMSHKNLLYDINQADLSKYDGKTTDYRNEKVSHNRGVYRKMEHRTFFWGVLRSLQQILREILKSIGRFEVE